MGSLLQRGRQVAQRQSAGNFDPIKAQTEAEAEAYKYGDAPATQAMADSSREDIIKEGKKIVATLSAAGVSSGDDWERASKMAVHGYDPQQTEQGFLSKAAESLSWLDKLGATVRFGAADLLGMDSRQGTEFDFTDFKDIWGGNWESITTRHGADVVGEEGRLSGGQILNNVGWDTSDKDTVNWANRFLHGVVGFAGELALDPLTYITGGLAGMSRKAALTAANKMITGAGSQTVTKLLKGVAVANLDEGIERTLGGLLKSKVDDAVRDLAELGGVREGQLNTSVVRSYVLDNQSVKDVLIDQLDAVGKPLANRDFQNLPQEWLQYALNHSNKEYRQLTGGARITANPFGGRGVYVPGTRGAGRALTRTIFGTPIKSEATKGFLGRNVANIGKQGRSGIRGALDSSALNATTNWRNIVDSIGIDNSALRAFQEGNPTAARAFLAERAAKTGAQRTGIKQASAQLSVQADRLSRVMRKSDLDDTEIESFFSEVINAVQHNTGDVLTHSVPEVQEAARAFSKTWGGTMEFMLRAARQAGIEMGEIQNIVPLVRSDETARIFDDLARIKPRIHVDDTLPDDAPERVARELLNEMLASFTRREGAGTAILGTSAHTQERLLGKTLKTMEMGDATLFEVIDSTDVAFVDHVVMNEYMTAAVMDLADEVGLSIPKGWTVLESNPFKIADKYLDSMTRAINERKLIQEAKNFGLIRDATWQVDKGRMSAALAEGYKDLTPKQREALETVLDEAKSKAESLDAFRAAGVVPPVLSPLKMETVHLGGRGVRGLKMEIPSVLRGNKRVEKLIDQADRHLRDKWTIRGGVQSTRKQQIATLKARGAPPEFAEAAADAETYEAVYQLARELELAIAEELEIQAKGIGELVAKIAAEGGPEVRKAQTLARAELRKFRDHADQVIEAGNDAIKRTLDRHGVRPVSVVPVNNEQGRRLVADRFVGTTVERINALADQAGNISTSHIPAVERAATDNLANKLREIGATMASVPENHAGAVDVLKQQLREAKELIDTINGVIPDRLTFSEWVDSVPKRSQRMRYTDQEKLLKELADDPLIQTDGPLGEYATDELRSNAREMWFKAFAKKHQVDPRSLLVDDRKKLKVLLRSGEGSQAAKDAILNVGDMKVSDRVARSMMNMVLDVAEKDQRPAWVRAIDLDTARAMQPNDFWETYGATIGRGATEGSQLKSVLDTHTLVHNANMASKNIDRHLAGRIVDEFELIASLYEGRNVWGSANLRDTLLSLFAESPWSATHRLRGMKGAGFQMESLEEVTTLTANQLQRELKTAGWTDSLEEAAQAIVDGKLTGLSDEAIATLGYMPTQDARFIDELAGLHMKSVENAIQGAADAAQVTVREAIDSHKVMDQLGRYLKRRTADGKLAPSALRNADELLVKNDKLLRRTLPKQQWPVLDQMRQQIDTAQTLRQRGLSKQVKDLIENNNALRNDMMFDSEPIQRELGEQLKQMEAMAADEQYDQVQGSIGMFKRYAEIVQELMGMGAEPKTGRLRSMWATDDDLDYINALAKEGRKIGRDLDSSKLVELLDDPASLGKTPSVEDALFVPPATFGLAGPGLDNKVMSTDLGKFIEHTTMKMAALNTPVGLQQFATKSRQVMHWWKGMATVANPNFHIRNVASAMWNNELVDVGLKDYAFVAKHWKSLKRGFKKYGSWLEAAENLDDPLASFMFRNAAENGLFDATFANSELLSRAARRTGGTTFQKTLGNNNALLEVGGATMESIEGFMRLAAFVRHMPNDLAGSLDRGLVDASSAYANDLVNMVHFDYQALTRVETKLKEFIPFFVWTRRNLPLQMRMMVERPQMLAAYSHLVHSARSEFGTSDEIGPRRYGGTSYVGTDMFMNEDTPFWARFLFDPDLPVKDLEELGNPFSPMTYLNLGASLLGPHIQTPMKAYFEDSYETNAPVGWQSLSRGINFLLSDSDTQSWGETRPRVTSTQAELLKMLFPPASTYLTAFEQDPKRMAKEGIVEGDVGSRIYAGLRDLALPGLGVKTHTAADEYSVYSSSRYNNILADGRRSGLITAETEAAVNELLKQNR